MQRTLIKDMMEWKSSKSRKPLVIQGARQVGKTWLMKEFGKLAYKKVHYLNFEANNNLRNIFAQDYDISRVIQVISVAVGENIVAKDTLLIFDEIQEAERGLTALKYFQENAPDFHVIAAGSLLGTSIQIKQSFPVGKVDFLRLNPMTFEEFLMALKEDSLTGILVKKDWASILPFHEKLTGLLRLYYYIGGMPEAVASYVQNSDLAAVRKIQENILLGYENDFAKYAPKEVVPRIRMVWASILSQLAKENRKYIYGQVKHGSRAKDFEAAINWLSDAGLAIKTPLVEKGILPLRAYAEYDSFKLFMVDVGLLNAMAGLPPTTVIERNYLMIEFKGALTEQFVCQQLTANSENQIYYWSSNGVAEVDFVVQNNGRVMPIEVKAEENLKAKSLKIFVEKYSPELAIRASMNTYREESWMVNTPLYGVGFLFI